MKRRPGGRRRRPRRSGAEARRAILAAAEKRLVRGGPEAIRLKEIAADAGISHPAILHHFGSRDGLLRALVQHALRGLQEELVGIVGNPAEAPARSIEARVERVTRMLERTSSVLAERGYARLLAWLVLSGRDVGSLAPDLFTSFPGAVHAVRTQRRLAEGRQPPSLHQTRFGTAMTMATLLGDALFGPFIRAAVGLPDEAAMDREFRAWMAKAIETA